MTVRPYTQIVSELMILHRHYPGVSLEVKHHRGVSGLCTIVHHLKAVESITGECRHVTDALGEVDYHKTIHMTEDGSEVWGQPPRK